MENYEHRIVNGLLKAGIPSPGRAAQLLFRDVEIHVEEGRASELAPATWALVASLRRQFTGSITLNAPTADSRFPLPIMGWLSPRPRTDLPPLRVALGSAPPASGAAVWGDVRGGCFTFREGASRSLGEAHPTAAFALSGYLAFASLAEAVGIPPFRLNHARARLTLPAGYSPAVRLPQRIALLGLGQIGQAMLALLHFLAPEDRSRPSLSVVDYDAIGTENFATQVLLPDEHSCIGTLKVDYLADLLSGHGWNVERLPLKLAWGLPRPSDHPPIALVGFDNLESRRIAVAWEYDWLFESGVGTSLFEPRVTWSSLPPDSKIAGHLFREPTLPAADSASFELDPAFAQSLEATPGKCGWLRFRNVSASAPALGIVAAAFALSELLRWNSGTREPVRGAAHLWSPLLPYFREPL